ncbi:MAG: TIGR04255 family protein [Candidatus Nanopelagicales bacterium]
MFPNREVFANAPLALVAAEVRFTDAARLRQQQTKDEIAMALEDRFPYAEPLQQTNFNLPLGGGPPQVQEQLGVVLKNASSTETLTIMSESLTYETTAYDNFEHLLEAVTGACSVLVEAKVRPALQRVGLRYIDEIRVSEDIVDMRQWKRWINERLVGQLDALPTEVPATRSQAMTTFDLGGGRGLNFRCTALDQGTIVVPQHLRRKPVESGPFFVLDFDGFHDFTTQDTVELSAEVVRDALSAVHVPCGTAFQNSITDEARELFRGERS